jgi:hypothetical protein
VSTFSKLNRSSITAITIAVATIIFFSGIAYTLVRPVSYSSQATMVLTPKPTDDLAGVLDSFQRSGTAVTYVEFLASGDLLEAANDPPVTVSVRSVPDSRIIRISAEGSEKGIVKPALQAILTAANQEEDKLVDIWTLRTLQAPSDPSPSSTSTSLILMATILLALLGAVCTWTLLRRYGSGQPPGGRGGDGARAEALAAAGWLTREGPRYPTEGPRYPTSR